MKITTPVIQLTGFNDSTKCAEIECTRCHTVHRAYCTLSVDPTGTAERLATQAANSWLRNHPCNGRA
jgi:hypothetical protein